MKKRIISLLTAIALTASVAYAISAQTEDKEEDTADALNELGLFIGTGSGYNLEGELDRASSVTLIVRMLGKEAEARANASKYEMPFEDVKANASWSIPFVGYAYENNITKGTGGEVNNFNPSRPVTEKEFLTFALRALGYDAFYAWDNAYSLSVESGLIEESEADEDNADAYLRSDAVGVVWNALEAKLADKTMTLADKLISQGVFSENEFSKAKLIKENGKDAVADETTAAPEETTEASHTPPVIVPTVTTKAPEETTTAPEETTTVPEETTTVPEETTTVPEETTTVPEETTTAPEETTTAPEETTTAPEETTTSGGGSQIPFYPRG